MMSIHENKLGQNTVAFDAASARTVDENGYMRVAGCAFSKACVNPYRGNEIPGWEALGLDPDKIYQGWRAPDALRAACASFAGVPLLSGHHAESADDPQKDFRVGSLGTDVTWDAPYLRATLIVTDAAAIRGIERGTRRELSAAYVYDPDFTAGVADGEPYDFVMRNIRGNHVALVAEGRAGADVVVADSAPGGGKHLTARGLIMKTVGRFGKMLAFLGAADAAPDSGIEKAEVALGEALIAMHQTDPETGDLIDAPAGDEDKNAKIAAVVGKYFSGADEELKKKLLGALNDLAYAPAAGEDGAASPDAGPGGEPGSEPKAERKVPGGKDADPLNAPPAGENNEAEKLKAEGLKKAMAACGLDAEDPAAQKAFAEGVAYGEKKEKAAPAKPAREPESEGAKAAMDAALAHVRADMKALAFAARKVRPILGEVDAMAYDSASGIYADALKAKGLNPKQYPAAGYAGIVDVLLTQDQQVRVNSAQLTPGVNKFDGVFAALNQ